MVALEGVLRIINAFQFYTETQVLGFAESIPDWYGLSGPLAPTAFWIKQSGMMIIMIYHDHDTIIFVV